MSVAVGMGGFVWVGVGRRSEVAWHGWVVQISSAGVGWQGGKVVSPGRAAAGIEVCESVGGDNAVDGGVVVGPDILLVRRLSDDGGWGAVTVSETLVGWEALSVG